MIVNASDLIQRLQSYYDHGLPPGDKTAWSTLDPHYTVRPGQMTVVTGIPSHGKSEFLDALMVNLTPQWQFVVFSPENFPHELHISKILEKWHDKPFGPGLNERIAPNELADGVGYVDHCFGFFKPTPNRQVPDVVTILNEAGAWFDKRESVQKRGLVIDPWNELEHQRPGNMSETEYISATLSTIRQWAREFEVHVWIVAHPMKLQKRPDGSYPVPTPYDISGSAHWRNKSDNCITIWRDVLAENGLVQIHVTKVRFKHIGKPGVIELRYDRVTGRYHDLNVRVVAGTDYKSRAAGEQQKMVDF